MSDESVSSRAVIGHWPRQWLDARSSNMPVEYRARLHNTPALWNLNIHSPCYKNNREGTLVRG
jgi:hypothetical protein